MIQYKAHIDLSADEKQEAQFQKLLAPKDPEGKDFKFEGPEAEKLYKEKLTRIKDAIQLKKQPDRVPVCPLPGMFPFNYAGFTIQEVMYDYDKCVSAFKKFVLDFEPDMHIGAAGPGPGAAGPLRSLAAGDGDLPGDREAGEPADLVDEFLAFLGRDRQIERLLGRLQVPLDPLALLVGHLAERGRSGEALRWRARHQDCAMARAASSWLVAGSR